MHVGFGANVIRIWRETQALEERLSVDEKSSITGSIAKDNDAYSLHRTGVGVHLNELESSNWLNMPLKSNEM